jgi:hypothetical protein
MNMIILTVTTSSREFRVFLRYSNAIVVASRGMLLQSQEWVPVRLPETRDSIDSCISGARKRYFGCDM